MLGGGLQDRGGRGDSAPVGIVSYNWSSRGEGTAANPPLEVHHVREGREWGHYGQDPSDGQVQWRGRGAEG